MAARRKNLRRRERRRLRSKKLFQDRGETARLVVFRSSRHIYGQIVNDLKGEVLVAASTVEKGLEGQLESATSKVEKGEIIGSVLTERAKVKKIKTVVFDRNGFLYHGRVKALAEGARSGGLVF